MPVALAGLGDVAVALMLLLLAAALTLLIYVLVNSLGKAPVIGSWISGTLSGWLTDARNALLNASKSSWHGLIDLINWCNSLSTSILVHAYQFYDEASAAISRIVYVRLPQFLGSAYSSALSLYDTVRAEIASDYSQATSYAASLVAGAESWVQAQVSQLAAEASSLFTRAEQDALAWVGDAETAAANLVTESSTALRADIAGAEQYAASEVSALAASTQAAVNQLANDITGGLATAETLAYSQLEAAVRGITTDLETIGDSAVSLAWPDAVPDLQALRDTLGADFPWLNDLLGLLAGAGTAGLLGALIRSMATSQALTRLATDCIVPNCRNLSGLGKFLQALSGDASEAAMLAWLVEAITNPSGWASDTNALLGGPANDTITAVRGLLGV
jgi:hypothetical protein